MGQVGPPCPPRTVSLSGLPHLWGASITPYTPGTSNYSKCRPLPPTRGSPCLLKARQGQAAFKGPILLPLHHTKPMCVQQGRQGKQLGARR